MFHSFIRAAVRAGLPPKQVIFEDPTHTEYDFWDLRLIKAYHFAEDFTRDGIPVWWDESDDVAFEVKRRTSRSKAALSRAEEQDRKSKTTHHGRYYVPVPKRIGGGELPTFQEWVDARARQDGRK